MKKANPSGAALIITLSLLILLTVCILAFMSVVQSDRQSASLISATTRAELLGRSAGNLILGDILAEVRDGSTATGSSNAISYFASTNLNAVPQRILVDAPMAADTNFVNLYKQSLPVPFYAGTRFASNGPTRVSDIGTWEATRNGRVLSPSRWNKPGLLFGNGFVSSNQTPRWAYFTRRETTDPALLNPTSWSTSLSVSTNDNFVIGRVAYNIYEIGGCLDANVAGGLAGVSKNQLLGSLAGASLTNIPGIANAPALVGWRNASSGIGTNEFATYATTNGLKAGFLDRPSGDRRFVARQDLIAYVRENSGGGLNTNSLPYLTHFSRGLDRPSLQATTNTTVLTGYPARPAGANPAPLTIRHTSDVTLPDGTKLKEGDPVAFRRFPLRRIGQLTQTATSDKDDANPIYRQFGLYRANKESPWIYDHGANNRILTLAEVKSRGREPDFFEMLQAAIMSGSLGGSAGPYGAISNPKYPMSTEGLDENIYRQILMIGANIIDQYDSDDFPTNISFRDASNVEISVFGIENLPYLNEIGVMAYRPAALPRTNVRWYLQFEVWNPHQNAATANTDLKLRVAVTNGTANVRAGVGSYTGGTSTEKFNALYNAPVASAYGATSDSAKSAFYSDHPELLFRMGTGESLASGGFDFSTAQTRADHGYLEFKNSRQLQEPFLLTAPSDPAASSNPPFAYADTGGGTTSANSIVDEITPASLPLQDHPPLPSPNGKVFDASTSVRFAGIMIAEKNLPDDRVDGRPDQYCYGQGAPGCYDLFTVEISAAKPLTIELQVETPEGWKTYQRLQNIVALTTSNRVGEWTNYGSLPASEAACVSFIRPYVSVRPDRTVSPFVTLNTGYNTIAAFDPRTSRFTYILRDVFGPLSTGNYGTSSNAAIIGNGNDWVLATTSGTSKGFSALGANISNHPSGQQYYKDPDGVVRRGDAEERPEVPVADQVNPIYSGYNTSAPFNALRGKMEDRPIILNRAFQSVGEMGYAFRDLPWKTLDLASKDSGDGALLDYFSIEETALDANRRPLRAGVINPNTASSPALEAVIRDAMRKEVGATALDPLAVQSIVQSIRTSLATAPLSTIASLPSLADGSSFPISSGKILRKTEKEAFVRALAPVSEVNVWNLMIDVVAQSGRFPPNATNLKDFVVNGEARYWIFAAIDRTTCKVIDLQFELVTE